MRTCKKLGRDIQNLGALILSLADNQAVRGALFGPHGDMAYDWVCDREGKYGPGPCGSYRITRTPQTARGKALGLKRVANVGNLYGLKRQLARDIIRLHGCSLEAIGPETGFEGTRRRHHRKSR